MTQTITPGARLAILGALFAFSPMNLEAQSRGMQVVVNAGSAVSSLKREELARILLGKKTIWESGTRISPSMLDETLPVIGPFLDVTLRKSMVQFQTYWKRLVFAGGGAPPRTFRSSAEVIDFVAKEPGAIGVIEAGIADNRVRVIQVEN
jgi:ABC-type phosphate transport system substrate-binding protein